MEIQAGFIEGWGWVLSLWRYEIATIDERAITLGTFCKGLALFILGYMAARSLARQVERRIYSRLDIEVSLRDTLRTFTFYFLLIIFTLFVLRVLNVPVTIFAVLGGALAIGVGFGSQNVVNNFICGLIVMIERPVRVGDIIKVADLFGRVEAIGARSTRLRCPDNSHMVVPNAFFLEKEVINWTLSDNVVQTKVGVGVAYGSPARKVCQLIMQAVAEQTPVLKTPPPVVLFKDFGESAMIFEAFFSVAINSTLDLRQTESEIRYRLDELFRTAGIDIAFPQREIHLRNARPLQVELMGPT